MRFHRIALTGLLLLGASHWQPANASGVLPERSDNTVVSPIGMIASLCGLKPTMSAEAVAEIGKAFAFDCMSRPSYIATAVWLPSAWPIAQMTEAQIFARAELYRGTGTFNVSIDRWLESRHALKLPNSEPIVFASVSALSYSARWKFPGPPVVKLQTFRGVHRSALINFATNVRFAALERFAECDRVYIALADGSRLFVTKLIATKQLSKCMAERMRPNSQDESATVALPELQIKNTQSLRPTLENAGVRSIFDPSRNPFPGLSVRIPLTDVDQSVLFRLDRYGVGVEATTVSDYALSGGGLTAHKIIFNTPFALRLQDAAGNDLADATIEDL